MNKITIITINFGFLFLISCHTSQKVTQSPPTYSAVDELAKLMTGTFSSGAQAASDSNFYDINLVMVPIWPNDQRAKWLYVEQAVATNLLKPYRQRIYELKATNDGHFESKVYTLPNPKRFIHGWKNEHIFNRITSDSLVVREGCSVFLRTDEQGCYVGATNEKKCQSSMRGASYATSEVQICADEIMSWDRGWNAQDEHVWGAEKGGYIFSRIE